MKISYKDVNSLNCSDAAKHWLKNQLRFIKKITENTTEELSYFNPNTKRIYLNDLCDIETVVHEYGHKVFDSLGIDYEKILTVFKKEVSEELAERIKKIEFKTNRNAKRYEIITDSVGIYYGFRNGYSHEIGYPQQFIPTELFAECLVSYFFDPSRIALAKLCIPKTVNRIMHIIENLF